MENVTIHLPKLTDEQEKALVQWMHDEGVYSLSHLLYKVMLEELAGRMGEVPPPTRGAA